MKRRYHIMHLSSLKKAILTLGLTLGVVSGSIVAFGAPSQIVIPGKAAAVESVKNDANIENPSKIVVEEKTDAVENNTYFKTPSQVVIPGKTVIVEPVKKATASTATPSIATRSTASKSSSGSGSSYRSGSARSVTTSNTNTTPQGPGSNVTNANPSNTNNVAPANTNNNGATKADVTGANRGKLNVPKTADASAMGLYTALLGLSTIGGAFVVATKKKEN
jgi:sortase B cell surface sorting signal